MSLSLAAFFRRTNESSALTDFNDPFRQKCVVKITIRIERGWFDPNRIDIVGCVYFKNGNTNGNQDFKADTFDALITQMKTFIDSLEKAP